MTSDGEMGKEEGRWNRIEETDRKGETLWRPEESWDVKEEGKSNRFIISGIRDGHQT